MSKKKGLIAVAIIVVATLIGGIVYLYLKMQNQQEESDQMIEVLEMDKAEMENEYQQFSMQYSEMMKQINNDSLVNQLSIEQHRTDSLLEELKNTKAKDAAEIMRLKKELATLRQVLKDYIVQIDSLNRENANLRQDNNNLKEANEQARAHISNLSHQNSSLSSQVAIASQLDASHVRLDALNKKGKSTHKLKDAKKFAISFTISRNVTTKTGMRSIYVRIITPTGESLSKGGTFRYENRALEYSIRKDIEYTGEEQSITVYWDIAETLSAGNYHVQIFADGQHIGNGDFSLD